MFASSSDSAPKRTRAVLPWVEKYRPKTIDEVSHQQHVIKTLKSAIKEGNLPHLLFYGPPGTGKTSTILAAARDLFGPEFKRRVLELNASDERGISVVRDRIKNFAKGTVSSKTKSGYACPPFKLIILDEADCMTSAAQSALRRTMEVHSKVTRFCMICNYVSRIIDPLTSRCAKFRFELLSREAMSTTLTNIAAKEKVEVGPEVIQHILSVSHGDMRKAITFLQSSSQLHGGGVTCAIIDEMAGVVPEERITPLWSAIKAGDVSQVQDAVEAVVAEGFATTEVLKKIQALVVAAPAAELGDAAKARMCMKLGAVDRCIVDGADEFLQLRDAVTYMCMQCAPVY